MNFSDSINKPISSKKEVCEICEKLNKELIFRARSFILKKKPAIDANLHNYVLETASGAKYLHRGYYCPSRMQELLIDNVKRGKIVDNRKKSEKISHKYYYNGNRLQVIDAFSSSNACTEREYLIYEDDEIYGITCYPDGEIIRLSAEIYCEGRLSIYYVTCCFIEEFNDINYGYCEQFFEQYSYKSNTLCDGSIFLLYSSTIDPNNSSQVERFIGHYQYNLEWNSTINRWVQRKTD